MLSFVQLIDFGINQHCEQLSLQIKLVRAQVRFPAVIRHLGTRTCMTF